MWLKEERNILKALCALLATLDIIIHNFNTERAKRARIKAKDTKLSH